MTLGQGHGGRGQLWGEIPRVARISRLITAAMGAHLAEGGLGHFKNGRVFNGVPGQAQEGL